MRNLLFLLLLTSRILSFSQTSQPYPIDISIKDFNFKTTDNFTRIVTNKFGMSYSGDTDMPELPYCNIRLLIPKDAHVTDVIVNSIGSQLVGKFTLPSNIPPMILSEQHKQQLTIGYDLSKTYPTGAKPNFRQASIDGYQVLYVSVCPFEYNAKTGNLYIKTGLSLKYKTTARKYDKNVSIGHNMRNMVSSIVENKNEMDSMYPNAKSANNLRAYGNYLIITADSLKHAFDPLVESKLHRGIIPDIVSIEDIQQRYSYYSNSDLTEKIKYCIRHYYLSSGIEYVLLGGDCNIVPIRNCYCSINATLTNNIPTDLYYACVDDETNYSFEWNGNQNNLYGEETDNIDMDADVTVSRIPASNAAEITAYVNKRIKYELDDIYNGNSYNKFLFAGNVISGLIENTNMSDVHYWGTQMCDSICGVFNADITKLYDTGSTIGSTLFSASSLQDQLNEEYSIVNIDTHGSPTEYRTGILDDNNFENYTTDSIANVRCNGNTLMVSSACYSNDFTRTDNLARNFLLSPNNGTLLYCGGTREGLVMLDTPQPSMSYSISFSNNLYKELFLGERRVGCCFNKSKSILNTDNYDRWLRFSINMIGDPDFEIYLNKPKAFTVDAILTNEESYVTTNETDYRFCIFDGLGGCVPYNQNQDYWHDIFTYEDLSFGITKDGFVPFYSCRDFCRNLYIQNISDINMNIKGKHILIGSNVAQVDDDYDLNEGTVEVTDGRTFNLEVENDLTIENNFICNIGGQLNIIPKQ